MCHPLFPKAGARVFRRTASTVIPVPTVMPQTGHAIVIPRPVTTPIIDRVMVIVVVFQLHRHIVVSTIATM